MPMRKKGFRLQNRNPSFPTSALSAPAVAKNSFGMREEHALHLDALEASQFVGQSVDLLVAAHNLKDEESVGRCRVFADFVQAETGADVLAVLAQDGLDLSSVDGAVGDMNAYDAVVFHDCVVFSGGVALRVTVNVLP